MEGLNNLDAFKHNTHTIYYGDNFRQTTVLNLFTFAVKIFNEAYIINNLDDFKIICDSVRFNKEKGFDKLRSIADNALIDSIKISICFENYLKGLHLSMGYIIHNIDKNIFKNLAITQRNTPIKYRDFPVKFKDNRKINSSEELYRKCIVGLAQNTLNYSTYLEKNDYKDLNLLDESFYDILKILNKSRNRLHLNNSISFAFTNQTYNELKSLKDFVDIKIPLLIKNKKEYFIEKGLNPDPQFIVKKTNFNT